MVMCRKNINDGNHNTNTVKLLFAEAIESVLLIAWIEIETIMPPKNQMRRLVMRMASFKKFYLN